MKILRVNMTKGTVVFEDLPQEWIILGGRALTAKILSQEVSPQVDPLGPEAKLIFACGPLAGTNAPSCGRISIGGKSPLTLGIKEANSGGPAAQKLDRLGIRAIIVEGTPTGDQFYLLKISQHEATLIEATQFKGMKNYAFTKLMQKAYGAKAGIISIGVGGERQWKSASITMTDKSGHASRNAARGGLGAVMGAKGLKAVILDDQDAPKVVPVDKKSFRATIKNWVAITKADPRVKGFSDYGTPEGISILSHMGSMPTENYTNQPLKGIEKISGEAINKLNQERGGKMEGCMPGCLVKCSIVFHDKKKKHVTSSFEYETIALMGSNLGLTDPDVIAKMDLMADEIGVDTIEIGSAMGVAASAGKMQMGDGASAIALLEEVEQGTKLGNILGNGVVATCKALNITRIPAFKGQAMPGHDPRATKPTGITYATNPMGADHTAGLSYDDLKSQEEQMDVSLKAQVFSTLEDSMGFCDLACPRDKTLLLTFLKELINARYGLNVTEENLVDVAKQTLRDELEFNKKSEFHWAHDPDPEFLKTEPVGPGNVVFDMDESKLSKIWDNLDSVQLHS